jgi:predicted  nucleic acid-binding Zn-ribbon protein
MAQMDDTQKFTSLQKRIDVIKQKRNSAEAEVKVLQTQYEEKVEEAKELGIDNIDKLPEHIAELEEQLQSQLEQIETQVSSVEEELKKVV